MELYRNLLGRIISRSFDNQYSDWEWALDQVFSELGLDADETFDEWIPDTLDFTEFLKFIITLGCSTISKGLLKIKVKKEEDHYNKVNYYLELNILSLHEYLVSKGIYHKIYFDPIARTIMEKADECRKELSDYKRLLKLKNVYKQGRSKF